MIRGRNRIPENSDSQGRGLARDFALSLCFQPSSPNFPSAVERSYQLPMQPLRPQYYLAMRGDHELLIETYANFNARKIDAVLENLHENVDWPNGMEGGRVYGRNGVRDYWTRQWGLIDPHVEPMSFLTDETGRTVVTVHQVIRDLKGKLLVDQMVEHAYRIEDGLIRSMEIQASESS